MRAPDVERRNKAQMPDEEKARQANFVIDNSGSVEETRHQVQANLCRAKGPGQAARF